MSIVFAAIVPHPPILLPNIGKENTAKLASTKAAFDKLADDLKASQADSILVISPHGPSHDETFSINLHPTFTADLEAFGDFTNKQRWTGDIGLAHRIREQLETSGPLKLMSEEKLDYGSAIPLIALAENIPGLKIVPLYYSGLSLDAHFKFGELIKKELLISKQKIAVIASGDMSHRVSRGAPAGYSPRGKKFDSKLTELLLKKNSQGVLSLDPDLIIEAGECGLRSVAILLGILQDIKTEPKLLSYEAPFGVGYMVLQYRF